MRRQVLLNVNASLFINEKGNRCEIQRSTLEVAHILTRAIIPMTFGRPFLELKLTNVSIRSLFG